MTTAGARFSITLPDDTPAARVLGFWQPAAPESVSFTPGDGSLESTGMPADTLIWRAELPADPLPTMRAIASQRAEIALMDAALEQVEPRLDAFIAHYHPDAPAAFSASAPGPEQALAYWLQTADQPASFALEDSRRLETQAAEGFLEQVQRLLSAYSWIETAIDGKTIACTRVGWMGDFATSFNLQSEAQSASQHAQTVALALASRAVWVRFAGHMITGALRLGVQLATPGGAVLALPGLWRFINDIVDEYRHHSRAANA